MARHGLMASYRIAMPTPALTECISGGGADRCRREITTDQGMAVMRFCYFGILMGLLLGHPTQGRADMLDDLPDLILCKTPKGMIVLYLDQVHDEGGAYYRGLGRGGIAELDASGVLHRENQPDCDGKTLEQLRGEGKTRNIAIPELEGEARP